MMVQYLRLAEVHCMSSHEHGTPGLIDGHITYIYSGNLDLCSALVL